MKLPAGIEKWGSGVLGLVSVLLVVNLVGRYRSGQHPKVQGQSKPPAAASRTSTDPVSKPPAPEAKATPKTTSDLAKYDPDVHFDKAKELDSRPLPDEARNPFDFVGGSAPPPPAIPVPQPVTAPPPPPPPIPLKAMGVNDLPGGKKEAVMTFNDSIEMVHEGDVLGTRFKILKITPTMIQVEDGDTKQTLELPIP